MVRRAADMVDPVLRQFHLEARLAAPGRVLPAVVREHLLGTAVFGHRPAVHLQQILGRLPAVDAKPCDVAGMVVDEPEQIRVMPVELEREDVALPHLVGRGALEEARLGRVTLGLGLRLPRRQPLPLERLAHRLPAPRQEQHPPQPLRHAPRPEGGMLLLHLHDRLVHGRVE